LTEDQILTCAIEAMTWKTEVCSVKIKKKGWLSGGVMVRYLKIERESVEVRTGMNA
jgi:hypothetical protein